MNEIKRYDWEDALIEAQVEGRISNGALLVALKLAKAINWKPSDGKPAGLYWKNDTALEAVGAGRSTYFKHRSQLFDEGFFQEVKGNLIPSIPESTVETQESTVETQESTLETEQSTGDNPFSVDICSEDVLSEDVCSEEQGSAADAPLPPFGFNSKGDVDSPPSLVRTTRAAGLPLDEVKEVPQSTVETVECKPLRKRRTFAEQMEDIWGAKV